MLQYRDERARKLEAIYSSSNVVAPKCISSLRDFSGRFELP